MSATYQVVPVSPPYVAFVLGHLWERGQRELKALGISSARALLMALESARAPGAISGTVLADGVPVMVAGVVPDQDGEESVTWFLATDDFNRHAKTLTKILRKRIAQVTGPVHIYSTLTHQDAARWFRALGFEKDDWQGVTPEGSPLYRFRRK